MKLFTKQEILLHLPKYKTKEEIEEEIETDLLRFRYQTYKAKEKISFFKEKK
jgi:hypothetical protein